MPDPIPLPIASPPGIAKTGAPGRGKLITDETGKRGKVIRPAGIKAE